MSRICAGAGIALNGPWRAAPPAEAGVDALFDRATAWCLTHLPVEPVRLGSEQRTVQAIDSSTIARWRSRKASALLGKGYCQQARRAVRANRDYMDVMLLGGTG